MKNKHFTSTERLEISILLEKGYSQREIAKKMDKNQSSISREIKRNSSAGKYNPRAAKAKARARRKRSKYQGMKVEERPELKQYVIKKLQEHLTPEEISGRIKVVDNTIPYISAKGIYKWLYSSWGQAYCKFLPKQRYKPRKKYKKRGVKQMIPSRVGIEHRPITADLRIECGHFEEDTMVSARKASKQALAVFCDRKSRYSKLKKILNMKPDTHVEAQKEMAEGIKMKTITYDNGIENKQHTRISAELKVATYFCNPYSSWEKGTVENTIGRIRRFIPKGADLAQYSDEYIQKIEDWLNHTPRKCLNYYTPYEIMVLHDQFIYPK